MTWAQVSDLDSVKHQSPHQGSHHPVLVLSAVSNIRGCGSLWTPPPQNNKQTHNFGRKKNGAAPRSGHLEQLSCFAKSTHIGFSEMAKTIVFLNSQALEPF
jgi:hypothetical protein